MLYQANYTLTTDIISDAVITFKEPGDSNYTTYQTTENLASQRNIGLSLNYSKQISKSWMLNVFFNLYNNHYRGVVDSTNIDESYTSFNTSFNTQYSFSKGWTGELSGFYNARDFISGVRLADGRGMFALGAAKQIWNGKASVKLNLRDPLYLMSFTSHTDLDKGLHQLACYLLGTTRRIILNHRSIVLVGAPATPPNGKNGGQKSENQSRGRAAEGMRNNKSSLSGQEDWRKRGSGIFFKKYLRNSKVTHIFV